MKYRWLGRISYSEGLRLQQDLVDLHLAGKGEDAVLLLEHEPVYTIGRTRDRSSLRDPDRLPFPVIETNRGGQATFHGPGQLVGYLILDLTRYGKDLHFYLRQIESFLIDFIADFGIPAHRRDGLTGVWTGERKMASIGVGVRKWISMHGFGLNITPDLTGYDAITPCGINDVEMTSLSLETGNPVSVEEAASRIPRFITDSLASLRSE